MVVRDEWRQPDCALYAHGLRLRRAPSEPCGEIAFPFYFCFAPHRMVLSLIPAKQKRPERVVMLGRNEWTRTTDPHLIRVVL